MTKHEILLQIEDPIVQMRMKLNHARLMTSELMMNYFHSVDHQTAPVGGDALLEAQSFRENTIRAEIIEDALYYMEEQLHTLELLRERIEEAGDEQ